MLSEQLMHVAELYVEDLKKKFLKNLKCVILFGSVARKEATEHSDIDLVVIFKELPPGRMARRDYLGEIPAKLESELNRLRQKGIYSDFSPKLKTVDEFRIRTPFLYELVLDGIPLYDPEGHFQETKKEISDQMARLGSRRRRLGRYQYLDLKPDYKPGEVFDL